MFGHSDGNPTSTLMKPVLYITYDGLLDPLGQSQVLPYLLGLQEKGVRFIVISYEKPAQLNQQIYRDLRQPLASRGLVWHALKYHKSPAILAKGYDVVRGLLLAILLIATRRVTVVHARSYVASVMALSAKRLMGIRFLFDMRGLWAEERVDGNWWHRDSALFKLAKHCERSLLLGADHVVVLTSSLKNRLLQVPFLANGRSPHISVIPTCVDLRKFSYQDCRQGANRAWDDHGALTFVYIGSVGTLYLVAEMVDFFKAVLADHPSSFFLWLTNGSHHLVQDTLQHYAIESTRYRIASAPYDEVAQHLVRAHVSVFFIKPCPSKIGSFPTKFAESLACGLPVVTNRGSPDMDRLIEEHRVGVVIDAFHHAAYRDALRRLRELLSDDDLRRRCWRVAADYLSLDRGVSAYASVYHALLGGKELSSLPPYGRSPGVGGVEATRMSERGAYGT